MIDDVLRSANNLIDHARYPIDNLSDPAVQALIERCRADLREREVCVLPGFLESAALVRMAGEAAVAVPEGYRRPGLRTCYVWSEPEPGWPEGHPRNRMLRHQTRIVAYDQIRGRMAIDRLYRWAPVRDLLAAILDKDKLYLHDCPYQALNLLGFEEGDESSWHFDPENEFTVTLLLQPAKTGGEFEIAPRIRSETDPAYDEIQDVLDGTSGRVTGVDRAPGSLVIFYGRNSLHRVSPVHGRQPRLVAVMCYEQQPGVMGSDELNAAIYGPRLAAL